MADFLTRVAPDIEVRSSGDGRTVYGLLVPFGQVAEVADGGGRPYRERFVASSFARTIRERGDKVKVLVNHDRRSLPIGKFTLLREDAAGLYGEARISKTAAGDEAIQLVKDGAVDSWSVSFAPRSDRMAADGVLERTEVALREASLVSFPAYEGALVAGVRSAVADDPQHDPERWRHRLRIQGLDL